MVRFFIPTNLAFAGTPTDISSANECRDCFKTFDYLEGVPHIIDKRAKELNLLEMFTIDCYLYVAGNRALRYCIFLKMTLQIQVKFKFNSFAS